MLVAAAVCPQAPMLVPEIAGTAASELAEVRDAVAQAVNLVRAARPALVIAVAPAGEDGARSVHFGGTFRRFGVDLAVGAGGRSDELCTGLLIARWVLDGCGETEGRTGAGAAAGERCEGWEIGADTAPGECARIGWELAGRAERVGLLVMGDGSARRTAKAPGYLDEAAVPFDDAVAKALADADVKALAALDPRAASDLMAAGRAPWQVLAGAVSACEGPWHGRLLSYTAPYGVGYFSAFWEPA